MILVKSILAGLVALILTAIVLLVGAVVVLMVRFKPRHGQTIGIDPVGIVVSFPLLWIIAVIAFALGFYWEYRRARGAS